MSESIRFGIIGLDHWYAAIPFAEKVAADPSLDLAWVCDRDLSRAEQVVASSGHGVATSDPDVVLDDPTLDVVACFTSVERSADLAVAAAEAGKHIVSVKPLALTLQDADRVVAAVEASGVHFVPSESRHSSPLARRLRELVDSGAVGDLRSGAFAMNSSLPVAWPDASDPGWWVDASRTPGGAWIDHAVYQIDRMRWLFRSPVAGVTGITANIAHRDIAVEDYGHAVFALESGAVVTIEDTWIAPPDGFRNTGHLVGSRGEVTWDTVGGRLAVLGTSGDWTFSPLPSDTFDTVETIVAALRDGVPPGSGVREARDTLSTCLDFYAAAGKGR